MSEQGDLIIRTVKQAKDIYEQIGLLLQEADSMMANRGWEIYGSTARYGSASVHNPREWVPSRPVRYYSRADKPDQHKILSAVVFDDDEPEALSQSLLIATTLYASNPEGPKPISYESDSSSWYLRFTPRDVDGKISEIKPRGNEKRDMRSVKCFAIPLLDVTDSTVLETRVIGPFAGET